MSENKPSVLIVVPNWNGSKFLSSLLDSLKTVTYQNFKTVIVDNGSTDDSVAFVRKKYPDVAVIESKSNLGFAAACNMGIKSALQHGYDFVLLLNNDTIVAPDFLDKMVATAETDKKIGIVGGKIYYFDEPKMIWFAGGRYIWWRASGKHLDWRKVESDEARGMIDCNFVTGCLMLIRCKVFDDAGFFYEPYFLTVEDLDFCYQTIRHGWKIKVSLDAKIWHKVSFSRSGEFSFSNGYYGTRNRLFFAFKRCGNYVAGTILLALVIPVRAIQWFFDSAKRSMFKGMIMGVKDFFKGKLGNY